MKSRKWKAPLGLAAGCLFFVTAMLGFGFHLSSFQVLFYTCLFVAVVIVSLILAYAIIAIVIVRISNTLKPFWAHIHIPVFLPRKNSFPQPKDAHHCMRPVILGQQHSPVPCVSGNTDTVNVALMQSTASSPFIVPDIPDYTSEKQPAPELPEKVVPIEEISFMNAHTNQPECLHNEIGEYQIDAESKSLHMKVVGYSRDLKVDISFSLAPAIRYDLTNLMTCVESGWAIRDSSMAVECILSEYYFLQKEITTTFHDEIEMHIHAGRELFSSWPKSEGQRTSVRETTRKFIEKFMVEPLSDKDFCTIFERVFANWLVQQNDAKSALALGVMQTTGDERFRDIPDKNRCYHLTRVNIATMKVQTFFDSMYLPFVNIINEQLGVGTVEAALGIYAQIQVIYPKICKDFLYNKYAVSFDTDKSFSSAYNEILLNALRTEPKDEIEKLNVCIAYATLDSFPVCESDGISQRYLIPVHEERASTFPEQYPVIKMLYEEALKSYTDEQRRNTIIRGLRQNEDKKFITIEDVDLMSGPEFETFVASIFQKMGYSTRITPTTGDQGIDVIAQKNNVRLGIQAKCYANKVGNSAIQEAVAGMNYYGLNKAMVVTNSTFTEPAAKLAQANHVILWDRNTLSDKIREL